jgi:hypothetical protein
MSQDASNALSRRGLRPAAELARDRPCGDRLRYIAGCRCAECRQANTAYEKARAVARRSGDWNGIVPATRAREHLAQLSERGIGRRTVGDVSGIADTVLSDIIAGRKVRIRARTERLILAVGTAAAADHALVSAAETWRLLDELVADGYNKADLARRLGYASRALQFSRQQVTVRNAYDVRRLYEQLRLTDASKTQALLAELRAEGFRINQILRKVADAAERTGAPAPDLTIRSGRIRADVARIVHLVHEELLA